MFSKFSVVVVSALATLAVAIPYGSPPPQANLCCNSVVSKNDAFASLVAALVGLDLTGVGASVGLSCSPITVLGNNCGGTTVVCDAPNVESHNLIAINCLPITL